MKDPKTDYNACDDFFILFFSCHIVAATLAMLRMESVQGCSQDSVNGGAQLGAVTRPYNRQNVIVKGAEVLSPALRTCAKGGRHLGGLGYAPPKIFGF